METTTKRPNSTNEKERSGDRKEYTAPELIKNEPVANVTFGATVTGSTLPGTAGSPGSVI